MGNEGTQHCDLSIVNNVVRVFCLLFIISASCFLCRIDVCLAHKVLETELLTLYENKVVDYEASGKEEAG